MCFRPILQIRDLGQLRLGVCVIRVRWQHHLISEYSKILVALFQK